MADYSYQCRCGHVFIREAVMGQAPEKRPCPKCRRSAPRYFESPNIGAPSTNEVYDADRGGTVSVPRTTRSYVSDPIGMGDPPMVVETITDP